MALFGGGGYTVLLPEPDYLTPDTDPGLQSGWDTFAPPTSSSVSPSATPILTEITRKAGPDQVMLATGDSFTASTYCTIFGQTRTGNDKLVVDSAQNHKMNLDPTNNMVWWAVPAHMAAGSAFLVWPCDGANVGKPLLVNTAFVTHAQDMAIGRKDKVIINDTVSVYGRNVAAGGGTWIYLEWISGDVSSAAAFVPATAANNRRVQFAMPGSINTHTLATNDIFRIWLHNGRGGKYGWSKVPYDLTVTDAATLGITYSGTGVTINPANGGDSTSTADTTNITNRIGSYGSSGGVIKLGAGTFYLNSIGFTAPGGGSISLEGTGDGSDPSTNTVIKPVTSGYTDAGAGCWLYFNAGGRIKNCYVDTTGLNIAPNGAVSCPFIDTCNINHTLYVPGTPPTNGIAVNADRPGLIVNSTIRGALPVSATGGDGASISQLVMNNVTLTYSNGYGDACFQTTFNLDHVDCTNVTCNMDGSGATNRGRAVVVESQCRNFYFDSWTTDLAPIAGDNGGEQFFLGEQQVSAVWTSLSSNSSGSATTVTFPNAYTPPSAGQLVQVVKGKGIGQFGVVASAPVGQTVTLDRKWVIDVDTNSVVHSSNGAVYGCIRNSNQTGGGVVSGSASCGWQLNAPTAYLDTEGCRVTACNHGISFLSFTSMSGGNSSGDGSVFMWCNFEDSVVNNCDHHDRISNEFTGSATWPQLIGVLERGTKAFGAGITSAAVWCENYSTSPLNLFAHDHCEYYDAPTGVEIYLNDYRDVWWQSLAAPNGASGTTTGVSGAGGATGANLFIKGTGGVINFGSGNKLPS